MKNKNIQGNKLKDSKFQPSSEMLQSLQAVDPNVGTTVTYTFQTPRSKFNRTTQEVTDYVHESRMIQSLNPSALLSVGSTGKKLKRNDVEVCRMLEDIRNDLGATFFTIN